MQIKELYVTEKPSVAREFAKVLGCKNKENGYIYSENGKVVTWCVGHLLTMSYPEKYDESLKKWTIEPLPFLPDEYLFEPIEASKKQLEIVSKLLKKADKVMDCGDSAREGCWLQFLVYKYAGVITDTETLKPIKRVWLDTQTNEAILQGIKDAKDEKLYFPIIYAGRERAIEDYAMGINYSRALTIKYRKLMIDEQINDKPVIRVGRVKTCVLGMVVRREREIAYFEEKPFYRTCCLFKGVEAEWRCTEQSKLYGRNDLLVEDYGITKKEVADNMLAWLKKIGKVTVTDVVSKDEEKRPPLLYNLAELQNDCSKRYKITPSHTLEVAQKLYEAKMVTYPRTDARVLSTAVCSEVPKILNGLFSHPILEPIAMDIVEKKRYVGLHKTRYCNDAKISDHYALIPTGQGLSNFDNLTELEQNVYLLICQRFLQIFYDNAIFEKFTITANVSTESFKAASSALKSKGFLYVEEKMNLSDKEKNEDIEDSEEDKANSLETLKQIKKGATYDADFTQKKGKTTPPKRYTSGSIILAMESAGNLIEDERLREQIKGSGIGTSATRAEIIESLVKQGQIKISSKTQIITPTLEGEVIYEIVKLNIPTLLNPEMTASWESGLTLVEKNKITEQTFRKKLEESVSKNTNKVKNNDFSADIITTIPEIKKRYKTSSKPKAKSSKSKDTKSKNGRIKINQNNKKSTLKEDMANNNYINSKYN